jgi:CO/xanthine dehydrogenase Mo-binding subunit
LATAEKARTDRFVRPDGKQKVTGLGLYTADLNLTGQLHAKFRYADHPHARITGIDTRAARALPGVMAVVTHEDVPDIRYGGMVQDRRLFAREVVRWEGDVVAAVAALTPEIASRAAALIEVSYEVLPSVVDFEKAAHGGGPLVHPEWDSYTSDDDMGRDGNVMGRSTIVRGDVAAALAAEPDLTVVSGRYVADSSQGAPIEPHALIAQWQGDRVTVWSSSQVPYAARSGVAHTLGIPESNVRIVVPLLGGGFGAKCDFHFEAHVAVLARVTGRAVKLVLSRHEEFIAVDHRREGMVIELETAVRRDGTLVARRAKAYLDSGAYCGEGGFFAQMAAMHVIGPYRIENVDVEAFLTYTNTQPSSSIRAPTAPQAVWALEQHLDEVAAAIDLEPTELRRRTLIVPGDRTAAGQLVEHIGVLETLERALELIGYDAASELPEDEAIGVASGWWPCFGVETGAYLKLNADGTGTIITGAQENGTGSVMALPLYAAEVLGMDPSQFSITYQDTDAAPWDMGSSGSQTTFNAGRAVIEAAADVRRQLLEAAAAELEAAIDDLELVDGAVRVKGSPDQALTIAEIAGTGKQYLGRGAGEVPEVPESEAATLAEGCIGRLGLESFLAPQTITHAAHVKVDRETGVVRVLRFAAVHDSGTILNRMGADGQVYGGVVMGIGQALSEGSMHDEDGRQRNPHLLDYKLVTCSDAPQIDIAWVEIDTPNAGPKGAKGVGEPPCVPTAGAVANAIAKVIGRHVHLLPMTPERVWVASHDAAADRPVVGAGAP